MQTGLLDSAHATRAAAQPRSGPDRCPTTTALHRADDGLIARVRVPGGRMTPQQARVIASAAPDGDSIELTSRGNLQLRGLTEAGAARATEAFAAAGLVPSPAHERARTIVASPFIGRRHGAGLDDAFVAALDEAIRGLEATTAVSGRVLTVVDDGTAHALAGDADLLIRWQPLLWRAQLVLGGREAAVVDHAAAPGVAAALLASLARAAEAHGVWRARELPAKALAELTGDGTAAGPAALLVAQPPGAPLAAQPASSLPAEQGPDTGATTAGGRPAPAQPEAAAAQPEATPAQPVPALVTPGELPIGNIAQADGRIAVRALAPLGRLDAAQLVAIAAEAERHDTDVRIDPARGVTLVDVPADHAPAALRRLTALGLITDARDPAAGLTACAGVTCTRTEVDVRAAARLRAAARRPRDPREHLVGCERRCGAPAHGTTVVAEPGDTPQQLAARAALTISRSDDATLSRSLEAAAATLTPPAPNGSEAAR